jgi:D-alanine transaminase
MEWVLMNGEFLPRKEAKVDIEDRGYQFGDGIYEVIRVYNGRMFTADQHLSRLMSSAKQIFLQIPYTVDELKSMLEELIEKNQLNEGSVYLQLTRGAAPRTHAFPDASILPVFVAYTKKLERPFKARKNGVKAIFVEDIRWLRCNIKSLNLLGNILAKQKAVLAGCYEAVQHRGETVTEGASSNIFIVKNGVVRTHPANNLILNGITRQVIISLCQANGIEVAEEPFTKQELVQADEVFLTSTTSEVLPIVEVNGQQVADGKPGAVTLKIQELLEKEIEALSK